METPQLSTLPPYKGSIIEALSEIKRLENAFESGQIDQETFDREAQPFHQCIHDRVEKVSRKLLPPKTLIKALAITV